MLSLRLTRLSSELAVLAAGAALIMTAALHAPTAAAQTDPLAEVQKLVKQGQHAQALEKTDAYLAGRPKEAQGRFLRGVILAEMNRSAEAIAVFTRLTEEFPELPEPYNNLAVLYAQQRQYDKARNALEMAIRTHPAYAIAHENLGDVYSKLASQAYDKALQLDTANTGAQTKLSLIRELISISARQPGKPAAGPRLPLVESPRLGGADFASAARRPIAAAPAALPAVAPSRPTSPVVAKPAAPSTPPVVAAAPVAPQAPAVAPRPPVAPTTRGVSPATPVVSPAAPAISPATAVASPATSANSPANNSEEVAKALQDWAAAWSRKDVNGYLARYAGNFDPPGGVSRKEWANERQVRISKPGKIEVEVHNVQVSYEGADKAVVRFRQHYRSANLKTQATKTIVFVRSGGKWLILQERVS